ncbi:ATP carrier protein 2 [Striga asiatica]|uniref:ATP carrier protein 2 n=1 Tax=Striga asiatica TaxID=4170 RepID=A0A5A7QGB4_STRAF|nr:ATP carrier protein 2 [Striga asiatica]
MAALEIGRLHDSGSLIVLRDSVIPSVSLCTCNVMVVHEASYSRLLPLFASFVQDVLILPRSIQRILVDPRLGRWCICGALCLPNLYAWISSIWELGALVLSVVDGTLAIIENSLSWMSHQHLSSAAMVRGALCMKTHRTTPKKK